MIHELFPDKLDNQWQHISPDKNDRLIIEKNGQFLMHKENDEVRFLRVEEVRGDYYYLFATKEHRYFLLTNDLSEEMEQTFWVGYRYFRDCSMKKADRFSGMVAHHLAEWYHHSRFCGQCGTSMIHSENERMMQCPACGNMVYPRISPAVIVAVRDGNRLLMSKYANQQGKRYNLIAGFVEIGETLEECCAREVLEETGIQITNIQYYRSQPWGYSGSLLAGFTAEAVGDKTIIVDKNELSEACWIEKEEIDCELDDFSLTNEMIMCFKNEE